MNINKIILTSMIFHLGASSTFAMHSAEDKKKSISLKKKSTDKAETKEKFLPMGDLLSEIKEIGKTISEPKTPSQKKKIASSHSVPAKLPTQKITTNDLVTPTKHKQAVKPFSEPKPKKPRNTDEIYTDQQSVAQKFLDEEKSVYLPEEVNILLKDFKAKYAKKQSSTLDITGLSARSRMYLLSSIVNHKLLSLPDYKCQNYDAFKKLKLSNPFWEKVPVSTGIAEFVDQIPTIFKIGKFEYRLKQGATFHQKGSGRLYGLLSPNGAEKYEQMLPYLTGAGEEKRRKFSQLLLEQKKDGKVINTNNTKDDRFFNGLNLLLDYEVARRLAKDDPYGDLPIISYIEHVIKNLHDIEKFKQFMVTTDSSLFAGDARSTNARNLISDLGPTQNSGKQIRMSLQYLK